MSSDYLFNYFNSKHENLFVTKATQNFVDFITKFLYVPRKVAIVDNCKFVAKLSRINAVAEGHVIAGL